MIYVSSSCVSHKKICDTVTEYASAGIKNIELSGGTAYYEGIENDLIMLKERYSLQYACHSYFPPPQKDFVVNLASCNDIIYEESIRHYINCIQMLERLDCHILSIHAGFLVEAKVQELGHKISTEVVYEESEAYKRFYNAYERIRLLCEAKGISLYLENNVLSIENYKAFGRRNYFMMTDLMSIEKMREILDFNLLLDLGHLFVSANTQGMDYIKQCEMLIPQAMWFHISDNNGATDQHLPLKKNSEIYLKLENVIKTGKNITLETTGSISEILDSKKKIEELML